LTGRRSVSTRSSILALISSPQEPRSRVSRRARVEPGQLVVDLLSDTLIGSQFEITKRHAHRVRPEALRPTVTWRQPTARVPTPI
jgi:hypothetical protein